MQFAIAKNIRHNFISILNISYPSSGMEVESNRVDWGRLMLLGKSRYCTGADVICVSFYRHPYPFMMRRLGGTPHPLY